ncbi:MAG: hypothetical protein ACLFTT_05160 [Candidatus Hydrogenedentota bacterium]
MAGHLLADRVQRYLARQTAWVEAELEAVDTTMPALAHPDADLDAMAAAQEKRLRELEHFARESQALLREWKAATDVPENMRKTVREQARKTQHLVNTLSERSHAAAKAASDAREQRRAEYDAARKGHQQLRKYHPHGDSNTGRIDRQV